MPVDGDACAADLKAGSTHHDIRATNHHAVLYAHRRPTAYL